MSGYEQRAREWLLTRVGVTMEHHIAHLAAEFESISAEARGEERERCLAIVEGRTDDGVPSWCAAIRAIKAGDTSPDVRLVARGRDRVGAGDLVVSAGCGDGDGDGYGSGDVVGGLPAEWERK